MSTYTQQYTRPYADGYKDRPDESTPEYARFINARDDALLRIEAFLAALNIPTKLSELVNDKNFIDATVSNLANYYLKTETYARTETYTQSEVQALIADAVSKVSGKLNISVVDALPTSDISTTTFYLVPKETAQEKNLYDEYINTDGTTNGWEFIGGVSTSIDLSDYYKKTEVDTLLSEKVNTSDLVASSFSGTKAVIGNQVSGGGGSALHNYSTEEKIVGTWFDGKPLYEKTFKTTVNATGSVEYFSDVIVEDAESYFIEQAYCTENENATGQIQLIGSVNISSTYDYNITSFNLNTGRFWLIRGSGTYPYTTIIVRYTKTTDTATI